MNCSFKKRIIESISTKAKKPTEIRFKMESDMKIEDEAEIKNDTVIKTFWPICAIPFFGSFDFFLEMSSYYSFTFFKIQFCFAKKLLGFKYCSRKMNFQILCQYDKLDLTRPFLHKYYSSAWTYLSKLQSSMQVIHSHNQSISLFSTVLL